MKKKITQLDRGPMKRVLGVLDLFAVGYGDLGSSIYYALGITAMFALGATPIALLLAGLVFSCTALTYAEMSSVMSDSGGSASFSRKAFNDLISFVAGWGLLLDYIVTIAISSYSVGPYLSFFVPFLRPVAVKIIFTAILVTLLLIINIRGVHHSTKFSIWLTSLTVITQVVIMVIGFALIVDFAEFFSHVKIGGLDPKWSPTWPDFWRGVAMAMVAYTGIESMSQLSSEAKNPGKTVPRAIVTALGVLLAMYIGISIVALSALTPQELSSQYLEDPIAGIVAHLPIGGAWLGPWVGLLAAVILIAAANAGLIGASRLSFNLGEYFQLPRFFYKLHPKFKTPFTALIFFAVLSVLVVIWSFGSLAFLADLYNFGAMLAFFCAHLSLILHRIRFPDIKRPFKIKGNIRIKKAQIPITAIVGTISTFLVWCMVVITKPEGRNLGIIWIAVGLIVYFVFRYRYKISATGTVEVAKIQVKDFEEVKIKKILLPTRGHLATDTILIGCELAKMYDAKLTVVHIIEIPFMMPLNTAAVQKESYSEAILGRAQAIALEMKIDVELRTFRSRSVITSILDMIEKEHFDLVVLGSRRFDTLGPVTERILKNAKCRVWICRSENKGDGSGGGPSLDQNLYHHKKEDDIKN